MSMLYTRERGLEKRCLAGKTQRKKRTGDCKEDVEDFILSRMKR
jgi:hypothetical protein